MAVPIPFEQTDREFSLRSPATYIKSIKKSTWYFEGEENAWSAFDNIGRFAKKEHIPFTVYTIPNADHFNIIAPVTEMIAQKILLDTGKDCNIAFSKDDIAKIAKRVEH